MRDKKEKTNLLASDEYRFLYWVSRQPATVINGWNIVKLSQNEIAQAYGKSPATIFHWLSALRKVNCIEPYKIKSGYRITKTGYEVITYMEKIEKVLGGAKNGH